MKSSVKATTHLGLGCLAIAVYQLQLRVHGVGIDRRPRHMLTTI
jgi:hypothetical protein